MNSYGGRHPNTARSGDVPGGAHDWHMVGDAFKAAQDLGVVAEDFIISSRVPASNTLDSVFMKAGYCSK